LKLDALADVVERHVEGERETRPHHAPEQRERVSV
jgi:hypothetical protein